MTLKVPVINIEALVRSDSGAASTRAVAHAIAEACTQVGFFYVVGHGVSESLQLDLQTLSRKFFRQDLATKNKIAMSKGGPAWRGYFPVGAELTSGKPDIKEGIYFGAELPNNDPLVKGGTPLHGPNLFPNEPQRLKSVVLDYLDEMKKLSHTIMQGIALSLGVEKDYFERRYTKDPLILFRIFNYPVPEQKTVTDTDTDTWGVGEHTDYGVLTVLKQDDNGGLEVKSPNSPTSKQSWIQAPPIPNSFVCNIGDMLDRITGGLYKSTPHRVRNSSGRDRMSYPFFFDPNFFAKVEPLPTLKSAEVLDDSTERWDKANPHAFQGTYGDYLLTKIAKVFPELKASVLK